MAHPVRGRLWLLGGEDVSRVRLSNEPLRSDTVEQFYPLCWPWPVFNNDENDDEMGCYGTVVIPVPGWLYPCNADQTYLQPTGETACGIKVLLSEPSVTTLENLDASLRKQIEINSRCIAVDAPTPPNSLVLDDGFIYARRWRPIVELLPAPKNQKKSNEKPWAMGWIDVYADPHQTQVLDYLGNPIPLQELPSGTLVTVTLEISGVCRTPHKHDMISNLANVRTAIRVRSISEGYEWNTYVGTLEAMHDLKMVCPTETYLQLPKELWVIVLIFACRTPTSTIFYLDQHPPSDGRCAEQSSLHQPSSTNR